MLPRRAILVLTIFVPLIWAVGFAAYSRQNDTDGWRVMTGVYHDEEAMYALMKKKCGSWEKLNENYTQNYENCRKNTLAPYKAESGAHRSRFLLILLVPTLILFGAGMAWYWVESAERH